jgi:carbamoylphosphate synthase large subunit
MCKKHLYKTVLIGSSGAGNAFSSAIALRRNWGNSVEIISIDINPKYLVTSSLLSDKFYQVPETRTPEFKKSLVKILLEENVDTYIPFIDAEIFIAASLYEEKKFKEKLNLQVKNSKIANLCNDKYETFLWLSELNILTPLCFKEVAQIHNNEKLILKPRKGFGTNVIRLSEIKDTFSHYNFEEYIIQQECEKPEITIDVSYDKTRNFFNFVCRERLEVKNGVCTKARLFCDKKLEKSAFTIADKLDLSSFCFQVMKYKGEWAVTDINARLGAGTSMSFAAGMDFFSGMFAILWGEDPSEYFRPLQKETFVTRQYCEFLMNF